MISTLEILTKGLEVLDASVTALAVALDKERSTKDVANAIAQLVFAGVQVGDLCVRSGHFSADTKLVMAYGSAGLEGARFFTKNLAKYSKTKQVLTWVQVSLIVAELVGKLGFRIGDIANVSRLEELTDQQVDLCNHLEKIGVLSGSVAGLVLGSIRLRFDLPLLRNSLSRYWNLRREARLESLQVGINPSNHPLSNFDGGGFGSSESVAIDIPHALNSERNIDVGGSAYFIPVSEDPFGIHREAVGVLACYTMSKKTNKINDFLKSLCFVPQFLIGANVDEWEWRCSMTHKPIRNIVVPNTSADADENSPLLQVMYEESAFKEWESKNKSSPTPPPGWPPENWPLQNPEGKIVIRDGRQQRLINNRLHKSLEEISEFYQSDIEKALRHNGEDEFKGGKDE